MKPPVIVVPGITATVLRDLYPTRPETAWGLLTKDYARVAMHPDDPSREERQPAQIVPDEAFSIPYDSLVEELRHDLSHRKDEPRPVYVFGHDWRLPLDRLVDQFRDFCDDVAARTALMRHYAKDGYTAQNGQVDLVGHSMGGLIITGYLARNLKRHRARKVVTLGTPFGGSFEAVIKIVTGTSGLDGGVPNSRERETARMTPALYHLLPENRSGNEVLITDPDSPLPDSLFDAALWQHGVMETLAEHIRLHGINPPRSKADRMIEARALLQRMLDEAARFRKRIRSFQLDKAGLSPEDWMAIVGIGSETRVGLEVEDHGAAGPFFRLNSLHRKNGYPMPEIGPGEDGQSVVTADLFDTGDGTVPYWAAVPTFLKRTHLIGVSTEDLGYWELLNRALEGPLTNLHGILPAMNRVIKLCARFLDSETGQRASAYPGIQGRRAPDALDGDWNPPFVGLREERPKEW